MEGVAAVHVREIRHPQADQIDLATVLRTVGDPVRLEIVRLLSDGGERNCGQMTEALGLPTSTGSYHLRLLREAGITRTRAEGTERHISLRRDDLDERFPGLLDAVIRSRG